MAGKQLVTVKKARGRPKLYKPEYAEQAYKLCLLGLTNDELAAFFKVSPSSIDSWIATEPDFTGAIKNGRAIADGNVALSLYKKATGFYQEETKIVTLNGEIVRVQHQVYYPPDTGAQCMWLKNRQRARWRDKWAEDDNANGNTIVIRDETAAGVKASEEVKIS